MSPVGIKQQRGVRARARHCVDRLRRTALLRIAACLLFALALFDPVHAQSQSTSATAPRVALVIGNSGYPSAPLKNPGNDATAIAGELARLGFKVTLRLNATKRDTEEAIRAFSGDLAKQKAVGLFYFAGHAVQLSWRNYLLPVDVKIERLEDVQKSAVDLGTLLESLAQAKSSMNIVILDACRDNPFGRDFRIEQKGLSQVDAPHGTLLAYATSPGNVAADGDGANGLYTQHLLTEMKASGAKIEDVFKRVRLGVRLKSQGQQIPWESTSLEEDFYFLPAAVVKKLSAEEAERQFEEELAIWQRVTNAKDVASIEDYLKRYPSGRYSELAQLRLDRLLAGRGEKPVQLASIAPTPFSAGTGRVNADFSVGDTYTYRSVDPYSKVEFERRTETVSGVTDAEVTYDEGQITTDLLGNYVKSPDGNTFSPLQVFVPEYFIGKKWTTRFQFTVPDGSRREGELAFVVVGREKITVPAGTFDAYKVEGQGWLSGVPRWDGARMTLTASRVFWVAPEKVRRVIAIDVINRWGGGTLSRAYRSELVSFGQSGSEPLSAKQQVGDAMAARVGAATTLLPVDRSLRPEMPQVGDTWTYAIIDAKYKPTDRSRKRSFTVRAVTPTAITETASQGGAGLGEVEFRNEITALFHGGLLEVAPFAQSFGTLQPAQRFGALPIRGIDRMPTPSGEPAYVLDGGRVHGSEKVTVAAGTFDAIRAEFHGRVSNAYLTGMPMFRGSEGFTLTVWYAPATKRIARARLEAPTFTEVYELESYKLR